MAYIQVHEEDILLFGQESTHTATSWYVYDKIVKEDGIINTTDSTLLFSSVNDYVHLNAIVATLIKDGELYDTELPSIAVARVHYGDSESKLIEAICKETI